MYQKRFTLTIAVGEFPDRGFKKSASVNHFGLPWYLRLEREEEHLGVFLRSAKKKNVEKPWSVVATYEFRLTAATGEIKKRWQSWYTFGDGGGYGAPKFVSWKEAMEDKNSKIICHVIIVKTTGLATKRHRSFDEPEENLRDVVLKVEDKKFHVLKGYLATHSPYFKTLFFGKFDEANKPEIELKETSADAFQSFLEVLYGEFEIEAHNVADLLILADKFESQLVRKKCEKFLQESDQVNKKEKLILAESFKMGNLINHCLESAKNAVELKAYLPDDLGDLSPPMLISIVKRLLSYSNIYS